MWSDRLRVRKLAGYRREGCRAAYEREPVRTMTTTYAGMDAHAANDSGGGASGRGRTARGVAADERAAGGEAACAAPEEDGAGPSRRLLRGRSGRFRVAAPAQGRRHRLPGDRAGADTPTARRPCQDGPPRRQEAGRAAARRPAHGRASSDHRSGSRARPLPGARAAPLGQAAAAARHRLRRPELDAAAPPLAADATLEHPAAQATFDDYLRALEGVEERLRTLEQQLAECAAGDDYREAVMTVLAELGDATRFNSARQLMSYLGLTPSEYSSGAPVAGTDHEDGQRSRAPHPGRERVALSPPAAGG